MLGAERVIAIDRFAERFALARQCGAVTIDYYQDGISFADALRGLSGGVGPNSCIDRVGIESHWHSAAGAYDNFPGG